MRYENQVFTAATVILDDNDFIRCRFVDCTLQYRGGKLSITDCGFDSSLQFAFGGAAKNTLGLLRSLLGFQAGQLAVASALGLKVPNTTN